MTSLNHGLFPDDAANRKLLSLVHPDNWQNPSPCPCYNLVVLGAGSAGLISAIATASLGGRVALVERHLMGGDCLNTGCVPSKSLIRSARVAADLKRAGDFGLSPQSGVQKEDFSRIMERLRNIRADIGENDAAARYRDLGVDVFLGDGMFTGPDTLEVAGQTLRFKKAVIATGASAVPPPIPGLKEAGFLDNETLFSLTERPEDLLVIGGGPIGCEMAQAFARLGSRVSLVQDTRLLPQESAAVSRLITEVLEEEGIRIYTDASILKAEKLADGRKRLILNHGGQEVRLDAETLLVAAGRRPRVEGLGLEKAGVRYDTKLGILVDDFLRTSNKRIYGAGDCCMAWKFTHAADASAQIAVQNALFMGRKRVSRLLMPWCTYTDPEVAHVGMGEREAETLGIAVETFTFPMEENDRAKTEGEKKGFVSVMVKKGSDRILGATMVSSHAGESIGIFTTAMAAGMGLGALASVIHPYPTQAEAIRRAAGLYRKSRLTPRIAALLRGWLNMARKY